MSLQVWGSAVQEWSTYTPDGRRLIIRRNGEGWVVQCGEAEPRHNGLLDVALIEAMRSEPDITAHRMEIGTEIDYARWVRTLADSLDAYDVGGAAT